jgi:DNA-directed RNA polymerase specialized sigma subunit
VASITQLYVSSDDEADLIRCAQAGERRAINDLLIRQVALIKAEVRAFGIAKYRHGEAEQACMMAIWRSIPRFDLSRGTHFAPFARAAVRWALRELVRVRRSVATEPLDAAFEKARATGRGVERFYAPEVPEAGWGTGWCADKVATLSPDQQRILWMQYGDGYARADVARLEGVSRAAITQRMRAIELALVS